MFTGQADPLMGISERLILMQDYGVLLHGVPDWFEIRRLRSQKIPDPCTSCSNTRWYDVGYQGSLIV